MSINICFSFDENDDWWTICNFTANSLNRNKQTEFSLVFEIKVNEKVFDESSDQNVLWIKECITVGITEYLDILCSIGNPSVCFEFKAKGQANVPV